jgi:antitoxin ParD1/3/4
MTISLTPDQHAWIAERVRCGTFASIEAAVSQLIDERIAEVEVEDDDLLWAKPLVDQALEDVAANRVITLEEHRARNRLRLAALKG